MCTEKPEDLFNMLYWIPLALLLPQIIIENFILLTSPRLNLVKNLSIGIFVELSTQLVYSSMHIFLDKNCSVFF